MGNSKGDATRERIVAAARRLYLERGIDAVSLRDVAAEAGVTYGLIHHHFAGQDALVATVIAQAVADFRAGFDATTTPVEMLRTFLEHPDAATLMTQVAMSGRKATWDEFPLVEATIAVVSSWVPDPDEARVLAVGVLAAAAGWAVLSPFLSHAADLDRIEPPQVTEILAGGLARLVAYPDA